MSTSDSAAPSPVIVRLLHDQVAAIGNNHPIDSAAFAAALDERDPLASFRDRFHIPPVDAEKPELGEAVYLCGNSLGLQPKRTSVIVNEELQAWAKLGVRGHRESGRPWYFIEDFVVEQTARLVGALPDEVAVLNSLTANLHFLMAAFYRPTAERFKIIIEGTPFPSDMYAINSQIRFHGLDPAAALVEVHPRPGEHTLRTEDILEVIEREGDSTAVVLFAGVQYITGQLFDIKAITDKAHEKGCFAGFDLAHAAGNIPVQLHEWDVDFACWCTYKYLNSGPGNIAGIFVHDRFAESEELKRFEGWWSEHPDTRFQNKHKLNGRRGAGRFALSNPCVLAMAAYLASVELFDEATIGALREKSVLLTGYLDYLLRTQFDKEQVIVLTPSDPEFRGCQLSVRLPGRADEIRSALEAAGFVCDVRAPDTMRVAPTPLYNRFSDVWKFIQILHSVLDVKK